MELEYRMEGVYAPLFKVVFVPPFYGSKVVSTRSPKEEYDWS